MHKQQLLALYGLKYNPFLPNIPVESLWTPPEMENFLFRIENLVMEGGSESSLTSPLSAVIQGWANRKTCRSWLIVLDDWTPLWRELWKGRSPAWVIFTGRREGCLG